MAEDDPYIDLEDNSSNDAIKFVQSANRLTMTALGSPPATSPSYSKILEVLQDDERIPFVSQAGTSQSGERILLNFWKDSEVSFKRVTTAC
jgi:prolyl oligopeptidase